MKSDTKERTGETLLSEPEKDFATYVAESDCIEVF